MNLFTLRRHLRARYGEKMPTLWRHPRARTDSLIMNYHYYWEVPMTRPPGRYPSGVLPTSLGQMS